MNVKVRFAPSPTGHVHIGNIRAAIFNWLFARHEGGEFLLRIEDTDRERSTPEAIHSLLDVMAWLKLDFDEEPVYQSRMLANHQEATSRLIREGKAYSFSRKPDEKPAVYFRIPYEIELPAHIRTVGTATVDVFPDSPVTVDRTGVKFSQITKKGRRDEQDASLAGMKDLRLLDASGQCIFSLAEHVGALIRGEESFTFPSVARLEFTRREVFYRDLVKGELSKPLDGMKDLVIVRGDGTPVFHLANVCDDVTMGITHIMRGDDHVENTFRHILLFHALGAPVPQYAHLPMIVNLQGKPYSKRDGDAYVGDFREKGFSPDALFNYLSLLGWSPGDDREKMTRDETVRAFTLDRIKSAPAQMDMKKLLFLNGQYLAEIPFDDFVRLCRESIRRHAWADGLDENHFLKVCTLLRTRTSVFAQVAEWKYFFVEDVDYDEKAAAKNLNKPGVREHLAAARQKLAERDFVDAAIEQSIREAERAAGVGEGKLNLPIRIAVTGTAAGAGLYETMALLGREKCMKRLDHAIQHLCGG